VGSLARAHTIEAVQTLSGLMRNGTNENTRSYCATALLDRGWGKPSQDNTHSGDIQVTIRKIKGEL